MDLALCLSVRPWFTQRGCNGGIVVPEAAGEGRDYAVFGRIEPVRSSARALRTMSVKRSTCIQAAARAGKAVFIRATWFASVLLR